MILLKDLSVAARQVQALNHHAVDLVSVGSTTVPCYRGEFWTSKQRQGLSIHEISYRACFKPQLPNFFIRLLTGEGDTVYDPFSGRGTTVIEAALLGRNVIANDVNPLSSILTQPRLAIPGIPQIEERLWRISRMKLERNRRHLSMFFHPKTEAEIFRLRKYLRNRRASGKEDNVDAWIRMVATNRLTGHSKGFFSVYTLPPNQAVTRESQIKINRKLKQKPEYRDTTEIILRKSRSLIRNISEAEIEALLKAGKEARLLNADARSTPSIPPNTVQLTVTSPPFLDVVDYGTDNWLRCWFNSIDQREISGTITNLHSIHDWSEFIGEVFVELYRITKPGGWVAFEVGEVRRGTVNLEDVAVPRALQAGFSCEGIIINSQYFTKTSNIWGISNNKKGTNTNRIALFNKK
jgi:hypothetical protein